ncbi:hypothetical protein PDE_04542 [Penicillium oxalicum 114-2]|uniref:Chromo domain-containing protein n=1 Tax=Penicillium oxalicum (strain 114-2 / CGMCC 5302) TaxID=933388 RepID=S8B4T5_PENO1|nr:hypothetical protein PDE_04542 [Penicillium oxalicum 114-2]
MDGDLEMKDAGDLSDVDSLASTAPSETKSEYEVEEVLAERMGVDGEKEYLLKWEGYSIQRASWEPPECFLSMQEVLKAYQAKCRRIKAGAESPFDIAAWEKAMDDHERETERRKEARRQKRAARAKAAQKSRSSQSKSQAHASAESRDSSPDVPLREVSRESSPDVPLIKLPASVHKSRPRAGSDASTLFVPAGPGGAVIQSQISESQQPSQLTTAPALSKSADTTASSSAVHVTSKSSNPSLGSQGATKPDNTLLSRPSSGTGNLVQETTDDHKRPDSPEFRTNTAVTTVQASSSIRKATSVSAKSTPTEPALGPLYAAFASNKSGSRGPDISQVNLKKPSEFPARTAAGVPVPFAKMTTSNLSRRGSQGVTKASPTVPPLARSSSLQTPETSSNTTKQPPGPSNSGARPFRGDTYKPSESRRSPSQRSTYRRKSPESRPRSSPSSPRLRSRSPVPRSRSPTRRQRSPMTRRHSPESRRVYDSFRPSTNGCPFVTVTRPKGSSPVRSLSTPSSLSVLPSSQNESGPERESPASESAAQTHTSAPDSSRDQQPDMSVKAQIGRMPVGKPGLGARFFHSTYFANPGEILAHIYFGPERHFIGPVRLCGLTSEERAELLVAKDARGRSKKLEMWFRDLCTRDQYETLCKVESDAGGSNRVIRTCWMEGFTDSNPEIFHMSELLLHEKVVGIYYPPGLNGYAWIAYSPKLPDFKQLDRGYPEIDPGVPIHLAVRTPLPPIEALKSVPLRETKQPALQPPLEKTIVPYNKSSSAVVGMGPSSTAIAQRTVTESNISKKREHSHNQTSLHSPLQSPMEASTMSRPLDGQLAAQCQIIEPIAPTRSVNVSADPRLKRLSSLSVRTQHLLVEAPSAHSAGAGATIGQGENQNAGDVQMGITTHSTVMTKPGISPTLLAMVHPAASAPQSSDSKAILSAYFERDLKISFKELSRVNEKHDGSPADIFYLHMPKNEVDKKDHLLLKGLLEMNGSMVWGDWAKFVKNTKCGVVLFHESFGKFHTLRPHIRNVQSIPSIAFWSYRMSRPLDHPDQRSRPPGTFFQRIFIRGGVYLLTEDILDDLKSAIVVFKAFQHFQRKDPGLWKVACWPNLMESLEQMTDDPHRSPDELRLLEILEYVIKTSCTVDEQFFRADSLDPKNLNGASNNILSLPVVGYGDPLRRASSDSPRDLSPAQRKADHLAEYFAGWALENAARFRKAYVITNCKSEALIKRWGCWGHINVFSVESFLEKYKVPNVDDEVERLRNQMIKSSKSGRSSHLTMATGRSSGDMSSPSHTPQTPHTAGILTPRESRPDASTSTHTNSGVWRPPPPQNGQGHSTPYR